MIEDENTPGGIAKAIGLAMIFAAVLILLVGCSPGYDMLAKVWDDAKATCEPHGGLVAASYSQAMNGIKDSYSVQAQCKNNVRLTYNVELK